MRGRSFRGKKNNKFNRGKVNSIRPEEELDESTLDEDWTNDVNNDDSSIEDEGCYMMKVCMITPDLNHTYSTEDLASEVQTERATTSLSQYSDMYDSDEMHSSSKVVCHRKPEELTSPSLKTFNTDALKCEIMTHRTDALNQHKEGENRLIEGCNTEKMEIGEELATI